MKLNPIFYVLLSGVMLWIAAIMTVVHVANMNPHALWFIAVLVLGIGGVVWFIYRGDQ